MHVWQQCLHHHSNDVRRTADVVPIMRPRRPAATAATPAALHPFLSSPFYLSLTLRFLDWTSFLSISRVAHVWREAMRPAYECGERNDGRTLVLNNEMRVLHFLHMLHASTAAAAAAPTDAAATGLSSPHARDFRPGSIWSHVRSIEVAAHVRVLDDPSLLHAPDPLLPTIFVASRPRCLRVCIKPPATGGDVANAARRPNPHLLAFTPAYIAPLQATLAHLSLLDAPHSLSFDPVHATLIFGLITTQLTRLRSLAFGWRMVHQEGTRLPHHQGFEPATATLPGHTLYLDTLLNLDQLESLQLHHVEFTRRAGEILHRLSAHNRLTSVSWLQREALPWSSERYDLALHAAASVHINEQSGFDALLTEPPSLLTAFQWNQSNGVFSSSNLRSLLALTKLTTLRVQMRHVDRLPDVIDVLSSCQQGTGRESHLYSAGQGDHLLRTLDAACAEDTDPPVSVTHTTESWCSAMAHMPTLTSVVLRHGMLPPPALRNLGVGLNQLKRLTLHACMLLDQPLEMLTPTLFMRLESFEMRYDFSLDRTLPSVLARTLLTLPALRHVAIVYCESFRLDRGFVDALECAPNMEQFHLLPMRTQCHRPNDTWPPDPLREENSDRSVLDQPTEPRRWNLERSDPLHPVNCCEPCHTDYRMLAQMRRARHQQGKKQMQVRFKYTFVDLDYAFDVTRVTDAANDATPQTMQPTQE